MVEANTPRPRIAQRWKVGTALIRELIDSRLENGAAALAFFSMLALFPTAIFGLSLLPYLPIPDLQKAIFDLLGEVLPQQAAEMFKGTVERIVSERHSGLLSFGLLFALWSSTSGVLAVMEQLDVVHRVEHPRAALRARGIAFLLLFPLSALTVVGFGLVIFGGVLQGWLLGLIPGASAVLIACFACFRWLVIVFALLAAIALLYRIGPSDSRKFRLFSPGGVFATLGLLLASFGLRFYAGHFGSYDAIYGSLGAVIVLLMWLFFAGWVFLIGAAINEFMRRRADAESPAPSAYKKPRTGYDSSVRRAARERGGLET